MKLIIDSLNWREVQRQMIDDLDTEDLPDALRQRLYAVRDAIAVAGDVPEGMWAENENWVDEQWDARSILFGRALRCILSTPASSGDIFDVREFFESQTSGALDPDRAERIRLDHDFIQCLPVMPGIQFIKIDCDDPTTTLRDVKRALLAALLPLPRDRAIPLAKSAFKEKFLDGPTLFGRWQDYVQSQRNWRWVAARPSRSGMELAIEVEPGCDLSGLAFLLGCAGATAVMGQGQKISDVAWRERRRDV